MSAFMGRRNRPRLWRRPMHSESTAEATSRTGSAEREREGRGAAARAGMGGLLTGPRGESPTTAAG